MAEFHAELGRVRDAHRDRLVEIAELLRVSQAGPPQGLQKRLDRYVSDMMPSSGK